MKMSESKLQLSFPYRGSRVSWFTYHPAKSGPVDKEGQWDTAARNFMAIFESFKLPAQMYSEGMTHHETVGGETWQKEVMSLFRSIEREKDVYVLEALAHQIFDPDDKLSQRNLPYEKELKDMAGQLRALDCGLMPGGATLDPRIIIKRGWGA